MMFSGMMSSLSAIDWGILGILAISVITGMVRGCIKEMIALAAWIVGIWLALTYSSSFASWFMPYLHNPKVCEGAAFITIVVGTLIVSSIINFILSFFLKSSGLTIIDKLLGIGFGLVRGVLIVSLMMVIIQLAGVNLGQKESSLYQHFTPVVNWINQFVQPYVSKVGAAYEQSMGKVKPQATELPAVVKP